MTHACNGSGIPEQPLLPNASHSFPDTASNTSPAAFHFVYRTKARWEIVKTGGDLVSQKHLRRWMWLPGRRLIEHVWRVIKKKKTKERKKEKGAAAESIFQLQD